MKTPSFFSPSRPTLLQGRVARGSIGTLLLKAANAALGVSLAAIFARFLGTDGFGVYAVAMAWVSLLTIVVGFGTPQLLVREVAAGIAKNDYARVKGILLWSTLTAESTALAIGGVMAFVALWIWQTNASPQAFAVAIATSLLPLYVLNQLRQSGLRAFGHVFLAQLPEQALQPFLSILAFLAAVFLFSLASTTTSAILSVFVAALFGAVLGTWLMIKLTPPAVRASSPQFMPRLWLSSALPMAALSAMQVIVVNVDVVMLGWLADERAAGIYRVSARLAEFVTFASVAISMPLAPKIAELYNTGKNSAVQELMIKTARWSFALGILVVLVYAFFGDFFLSLFGGDFTSGVSVLVVLSLARLIAAFTGPVGLYLTMLGNERMAAKAISVATLTNLALNFALIPLYGALGAAIATAFTIFLWNGLLSVALTKRTGFIASIFPVRTKPEDALSQPLRRSSQSRTPRIRR